MHMPRLSHAFQRSMLAPAAFLAPAALLAATIVPLLGAGRSHAAPAQAMQQITLRASAPNFPKQIPAGFVAVTLVSDAKGEADAGFARLNPGATLAQVKAANAAAQNSIPAFIKLTKLLTFVGGDNSIPSGSRETVVLDMRTPGLYGFNLTVGNGAGKLITFTVTPGSGQNATAPSGGVPVTLKDMKILGLPKQMAAGAVTLQLANKGAQMHEVSIGRLDPGKTQKDVLALLRSPQGQNGPPPSWVHDMGGMEVIGPHQSAGLKLTLTPGYYVAMCFMPDVKKQGTPHVMEGMITHFTVQ
jgi:hypothetical protein